jgi:flavin reductase (DIM6/NTAB) family NADH-FMN oxidoreductase RutF
MTALASTTDFVAAMGQHVSSVCIITTMLDGERFGLTATAMCSVSASPPRLLVCVNKTGSTHDRILASGLFCVNVLSETQDTVAKSFAGMLGKDRDKFGSGTWQATASGSPALKDAVAVFDCRLVQTIDQFSHSILIGEVVAAASGSSVDALLYGAKRFRTLRKATAMPTDTKVESLHF